ncbi:hypothetical protein PLEOSDRAFT_161451 [Pleurotus ostreatus PC15]|uniref:Uncharacterized protein n=1 Tax=Pleurotus ostreatus (strain PC15) TaxID=1137138 RepID=A0A067NLM8_PLEO1|nr:hypothetical protein PLEOSDRAFT_161451 [Pleurotus ostreatus PC15]
MLLSRGFVAFISVSLAIIGANAANDWTKPCFDGECAYDLPESSGGSGIMKLFGSTKSISDITPAAGWVILDCDPNLLDQEIRLVCETDDEDSGCNHVFDHHGPVGKIVRLPESCGGGPFLRIASMAVAEDQTLPSHAQGRISRRGGAAAQVHVVKLDGNFAAIDAEKAGDIKFAFVGATVPGLDLNAAFNDNIFGDVGNWVKGAVQTVAQTATGAVKAVGNWAGQALKDFSDLLKNKTHFEIKPTVESANISLKADVDLSAGTPPTTCPGGKQAKVNVQFHNTGSVVVKAGIVIIGNVLPVPNITEFAAFGGINGDFDAHLHVDLAISGGFTFEKNIIKELGIPGLSIPPLVTVGPYISLDAKAQGHLALDLTADVHLAYEFKDLEMWYPKKEAKYMKEDGIKSKDSDLNLQASAHLSAEGFVQGTLTPKLHLGITAINGAAHASIWVGVDAWVRASVVAKADAAVGHKRDVQGLDYVPPYSHGMRDLVGRNSISAAVCLWIDGGLHVRGGAEGGLLSWNAPAGELSLWESPAWEIYHFCAPKTAGFSKPKHTLAEVNALSGGIRTCLTDQELGSPIKEKVPAKPMPKP